MASMDDVELRETVESILGQGIRMLDVEKKTTYKSEEVLLINGVAVPLVGADGDIIRQALLSGQVPPSDVLNSLLISAGIWRHPVRLQTELTVKHTTLNRDAITVSRNGRVVDERLKETKEEDLLHKTSTEVWRAVSGPDPTTKVFQPDPSPVPPTPPKEEEEINIQVPSDADTADEETTSSQSPSVRDSLHPDAHKRSSRLSAPSLYTGALMNDLRECSSSTSRSNAIPSSAPSALQRASSLFLSSFFFSSSSSSTLLPLL